MLPWRAGRAVTGVISVKAGDNVNPGMVRDLGEVMRRDKHRFGLFVMKGMPTKGMRDAAEAQGSDRNRVRALPGDAVRDPGRAVPGHQAQAAAADQPGEEGVTR